uniref:Sclerostin n=1 Tax=Hucho hucho TaxID=62062 RepID=A0A4W5Q3X6_9TELE
MGGICEVVTERILPDVFYSLYRRSISMQVSLALLVSSTGLLLLQGCCTVVQGWRVLKNDATEIIPEYTENAQPPEQPIQQASNNNSNTMNRPKHGGRRSSANTDSYSASELSCRELRSTRYITDGSCRSAKPVKELVCSGQCMPAHLLPNSIVRGKWWRSSASDYRCIPAHSRTQRVQLQCPNGNYRTYKIRVVTSCKCKRYSRHHNQSEAKESSSEAKPRRDKKRTRLPGSRNKNNTPTQVSNSY